MATLQELVAKINQLKTDVDAFNANVQTFESEVTNAFNRLEQKILIGQDVQPAMDALAPISQSLVEQNQKLDAAIAAAKITGV